MSPDLQLVNVFVIRHLVAAFEVKYIDVEVEGHGKSDLTPF